MNVAAREIMTSDSYIRRTRTIAEIALVVADLRDAVETSGTVAERVLGGTERHSRYCRRVGVLDYECSNTAPPDSFVTDARPMIETAEALLAALSGTETEVSIETLVARGRSLTRYMRVMFYLATPGAPERVIPTKPE